MISFSVVQCNLPIETLKFGIQVFPSNPVFGSVIMSKCNTRYKLKSGGLRRVCQEDGSWSGSTPACESKIGFMSLTTLYFYN